MSPVLVVISGAPGAGKSTLAKQLAERLELPLLDRDDIKDTMFDAMGWSDREWSQRVGRASWELLFLFAEKLLSAGESVIVDSNFERGRHPQLSAIAQRIPYRLVEVHCSAPDTVLARRFRTRWTSGQRHPGHASDWTEREYLDHIADRSFAPLDESDVLIEVDTNDGANVDVGEIAKVIARVLREDAIRGDA